MRAATWVAVLLVGCGAADDGAGARDALAREDAGDAGGTPRGLDAGAGTDAGGDTDAGAADGCLAALVRVGGVEVFAFEASRADADATSAGADGARACSRAGVPPWTEATVGEARAACAASGFRLCSDAEWEAVCAGAGGRAFPYGHTHEPGRCNDHVSGVSALRPTGAFADCATPEGVHDLSGNVWELTDDGSRRGASFRVNAATFHTEAARCDVAYFASETYAADDTGFRCCR